MQPLPRPAARGPLRAGRRSRAPAVGPAAGALELAAPAGAPSAGSDEGVLPENEARSEPDRREGA
eukprot:4153210-Alexandrium_andersonii.AAC.1